MMQLGAVVLFANSAMNKYYFVSGWWVCVAAHVWVGWSALALRWYL